MTSFSTWLPRTSLCLRASVARFPGGKTAEKLDLYKKHKAEYVTPRKPALVTIKPAAYLAIAGKGEPEGPAFTAAIGALYNMAFTIKMARKFAGRDYAVCKLAAAGTGSC